MNTIQLYLNDQLIDVSEDSPIALTFQINDLSEVKNQQGNTSNQFKLPLTQNNRIILGYADDIGITDTISAPQIPYTQLSARIIQNGIEILPNAIAEISEVDDDTVSITILSGNVDFFDALGGQIADMGDSTSQWSNYGSTLLWKPFDHTWDLQSVANSQENTEADGWIYPIVDYGLIDLYDFSLPIDVRNQRPGFFIKKAIDILVQSTGYTATGSLLADPLYPLLIAQFSNSSWEHGVDFQNVTNQVMAVELGQNLNVDHPNAQTPANGMGNIVWGVTNSNWNDQFVPGHGFTAAQTEVVLITVTVPHLYFEGIVTGKTPSYLNVIIWITTPGLSDAALAQMQFDFSAGYHHISGDGGSIRGSADIYHQTLTATTELAQGQGLYIGYEFQGSTDARFEMDGDATWTVAAQNATVKFNQVVQCERILPDMSQLDFLKDTFQRFGIMCQTDVYNKTINFACLRDIINNIPIVLDWTSKCIDQGKQITYKLGSYAQVNNLEYQTDPNILPLKFGWDRLIINDQTLSTVPTDLIVSKFGPSFNRPYIGGSIAQIAMIDPASGNNDFTVSVAPRILVDQKLNLIQNGNKTVNFTDGVNTIAVNDVISVPYFYKPDGEYNLSWCDMPSTVTPPTIPGLKTKYYSDLQKILQNTKILVRYFLLTPRDIAELDLLVPIYLQQHNAYFYINKIDSWRKGQPCKVELVRIG